MEIERGVMKPKYLEIAESIEARIKNQQLKPGAILPIESALQTEFGVSRVTIRKSLQLLVEKGLINRTRGSGTYVSGPKTQHDALHLLGFIEEVSRQGKSPSSRVIRFELKKATASIAEKLQLKEVDDTYEIHRLRLIDGEPEIYEITHMPATLFPDLSISVMNGSKYEYVEKTKGLKISKSQQSVQPYLLDTELAQHLNEAKNAAILKVESVGFLNSGNPFEYTVHYFRLKQYSFEFVATRG